MISPWGIRGRIYILNDGWLLPLQAIDDFLQIDQQGWRPIREGGRRGFHSQCPTLFQSPRHDVRWCYQESVIARNGDRLWWLQTRGRRGSEFLLNSGRLR
jgi:hypothetical protein